jgi:rubrerythrin
MSLAEVLEAAMAFEMSAYRFYSELRERLRPEARTLADELAEEELDHYRLLASIAKKPDLANYLRRRISRPQTEGTFEKYISLPELPGDAIEDDLLAYAEAREQIAREHYGYLAETAPAGPLRDLFIFLRNEEQTHVERLTSRWSKLFSVL